MGVTTQLISVAKAAEISGYSEWTIRKFCRQGILPSRKRLPGASKAKNHHIRIDPKDLDNFLRKQATA
ncbi:Helix-turn-helix domain protein [Corynebacterium kalinowskii]|uniref:Helix-turn-helix domain protein n=1 Tax=Corynebacterium kalinowskii TaxID=2675216 RepID=A0A6B8VJA7_9CORY|nr:helix-turn-helix domain-containing protein [Corynebacterium kalinowskii]QGU03129.1 Helix-turn-helix domain protein [Corynebacterium kalinowskii]